MRHITLGDILWNTSCQFLQENTVVDSRYEVDCGYCAINCRFTKREWPSDAHTVETLGIFRDNYVNAIVNEAFAYDVTTTWHGIASRTGGPRRQWRRIYIPCACPILTLRNGRKCKCIQYLRTVRYVKCGDKYCIYAGCWLYYLIKHWFIMKTTEAKENIISSRRVEIIICHGGIISCRDERTISPQRLIISPRYLASNSIRVFLLRLKMWNQTNAITTYNKIMATICLLNARWIPFWSIWVISGFAWWFEGNFLERKLIIQTNTIDSCV